MGRKGGFCGDGDYIVVSLNVPILLRTYLNDFLDITGNALNETACKGICHEIGKDWETVKAENAKQYPKALRLQKRSSV